MKVVEFRLAMPMTCEQYKICQLYLIAKASLEDTGYGEGMRILLNTTYEDNGITGQYTHKRISLASKMPGWLSAFVDPRFVVFDEKSWNGFPRLKTLYESEIFPKIKVTVESHHVEGIGTDENALNLSPELLRMRKVVDIDIVNDPIPTKDYKAEEDPSVYRCEEANLGPFDDKWKTKTEKIMTCYKVFVIDIPYFGLLASRIENWAMSTMRDQLFSYHRRACCWMHEWHKLSLDDIRKMEDEVKAKLDAIYATGLEQSESMEGVEESQVSSSASEEEPENVDEEDVIPTLDVDYLPEGEADIAQDSTPLEGHRNNPPSALNLADVTHTGYLFKLGDGFLNTAWNQRYVVLKGGKLLYFNDPRDARPKDSIDLRKAQVTWAGEIRERSHSFVVQPLGRRPLHFSGDSDEATKQWMLWLQLSADGQSLMNFSPEELNAMQPSPPPKPMSSLGVEDVQRLSVGAVISESNRESHSDLHPILPRERVSSSLPVPPLKASFSKGMQYIKLLRQACEGVNFTLVGTESGVRLSVKDISAWETFASALPQREKNTSPRQGGIGNATKVNGRLASDPAEMNNPKNEYLKKLREQYLFVLGIFLGLLSLLVGLQLIFNIGAALVELALYLTHHPLFLFSLRNVFSVFAAVIRPITKRVLLLSVLLGGAYGILRKFSNSTSKNDIVVKASTVVWTSAVETFAYLMDPEKTKEWLIGFSHSHRVDPLDSHNDYLVEVFKPVCLQFPWSFSGSLLSRLVKRRQLCRIRMWDMLADGSYLIILCSSPQNNAIIPKRRPDCVMADGYECLLITPLSPKTSAVTFLSAINLNGRMPRWYAELCSLQRAASLVSFRDAVLYSQTSSHDLQQICSTPGSDSDLREDGEEEEYTESHASGEDHIVTTPSEGLPAREEWFLEGFTRVRSGGLRLTDQHVIDKQKGVVLELIKSGSKALWEGKGIIGISLPVRIFEPKSLLQRLARGWGLAPTFLTAAAAEKDNPLERLKLCIAFVIGSLHLGCSAAKPFNPILGETYHTTWEDGTRLYFEHTSHHPPIAHYSIIGPNASYRLYGYYEFKGQFKGNYAFASQEGPSVFETPDGNRIEWKWPTIKVSGLIWGSRTFEWVDRMDFHNPKNDLTCTIQLGAAETSRLLPGRSNNPSDTFQGSICKDVTQLAAISGNWLQNIRIDGKEYWDISKSRPLQPVDIPLDKALPSDSRRRGDLMYLELGDEEKAQSWKVQLEVKQRQDRQLRGEYRKAHGIPEPYCT